MVSHSGSISQASWKQIRNYANQFSSRWQRKLNEERDSFLEIAHAQTFCNEFFWIFGQERANVAFFEKHIGRNRSDCFWPGVLLIEWKKPGKDLREAWNQVVENYISNLSENERPSHYMVSDFKIFHLIGKNQKLVKTFSLLELSKNVELFDFMINFNMIKRIQGEIDTVWSDVGSEINNLISKVETANRETRNSFVNLIRDTNNKIEVGNDNLINKIDAANREIRGSVVSTIRDTNSKIEVGNDNLSSKIETANREINSLVVSAIRDTNKNQTLSKNEFVMPKSIIRDIRKSILWLLLINLIIGLASGLNLYFIIRSNRPTKVSFDQAPMINVNLTSTESGSSPQDDLHG